MSDMTKVVDSCSKVNLCFAGGLFGFSRMTKAKHGKPTFVSFPNLTLWKTFGRTYFIATCCTTCCWDLKWGPF